MDGNAKQLLSERIKNATNVLVTVSRDPSVDELSAALALTLMLNKMDKHGTAVFSGAIPPAIEFLNPEKTFEGTVDSLRDFIIALDKEKADRLRYKVEDDVVKIFITPYRTTISEKDLQFSQGDFNVELIVALGVEKREDLDNAITAHGRILHDATVATVNAGEPKSDIGSIDWSDSSASSLCEMLMSLSESLQSGLLDQQIATALLTGIVSATDRFSNTSTSPKVMTMAAQLMAAGANQQLIATKLEQGHVLSGGPTAAPDGSKKLSEGESQKVKAEEKPADGEMHIDHEAANPASPTSPPAPIEEKPQTEKPPEKEEKQADELASSLPPATPNLSVDDLKKDLAAASQDVEKAAETTEHSDWRSRGDEQMGEPSFGGTLNATTDEAAAEKRREEESRRNHKLLSHDRSVGDVTPITSGAMAGSNEPPSVDPFAEAPKAAPDLGLQYEPTPLTPPAPVPEPVAAPLPPPPAAPAPESPEVTPPPADEPHVPTLVDLEKKAHETPIIDENSSLTDARAAVDAALRNMPFDPAREPLQATGATPFPEISHHEEAAQPPAPTPAPAPAPEAGLPLPPPLPDFEQDDHLPPPPLENPATTPPAPAPQTPPAAGDPGQFKLPGQ